MNLVNMLNWATKTKENSKSRRYIKSRGKSDRQQHNEKIVKEYELVKPTGDKK